ncbi:maleylpyruvate isomerase family mycothiol-dependent enzyme [Geodermatophilus sp. SYSU D00815]
MVPETLPWWEDGERHLGTALGRLVDEEFDAPSLLPGWSRRHVLAHVARNADALVNLLTWARTGVETPMYPSPEARDAGIAETARLAPDELRGELLRATERLAEAVRGMPEEAWTAEVRTFQGRAVRTFQGRAVPAAEVPWMRCREVWVHAVDLATGVTFDDVPEDVQAALVDDVFRMWDVRDEVPDVVLFAGDREWGTGALAVAGPLPAVTAWVTGRSAGDGLTADGDLPTLAPWL